MLADCKFRLKDPYLVSLCCNCVCMSSLFLPLLLFPETLLQHYHFLARVLSFSKQFLCEMCLGRLPWHHIHTHCAAVAEDCPSVINALIAPSGGVKLVFVTVKLVQLENWESDLLRLLLRCGAICPKHVCCIHQDAPGWSRSLRVICAYVYKVRPCPYCMFI